MKFEWDQNKSHSNLRKHGISFDDAISMFEGPVLTAVDARHFGEVREISFGQIGALVVLAIVHTDRFGVTRIISARKANQKERMLYYAHLARTFGPD